MGACRAPRPRLRAAPSGGPPRGRRPSCGCSRRPSSWSSRCSSCSALRRVLRATSNARPYQTTWTKSSKIAKSSTDDGTASRTLSRRLGQGRRPSRRSSTGSRSPRNARTSPRRRSIDPPGQLRPENSSSGVAAAAHLRRSGHGAHVRETLSGTSRRRRTPRPARRSGQRLTRERHRLVMISS